MPRDDEHKNNFNQYVGYLSFFIGKYDEIGYMPNPQKEDDRELSSLDGRLYFDIYGGTLIIWVPNLFWLEIKPNILPKWQEHIKKIKENSKVV